MHYRAGEEQLCYSGYEKSHVYSEKSSGLGRRGKHEVRSQGFEGIYKYASWRPDCATQESDI